MPCAFYDLSVGSYLQGLSGLAVVLRKGRDHAESAGLDPDAFVRTQFWEDMRPLEFQVQSATHHSVGAIEGLRRGEFSPPPPIDPQTYAGLEQMVADAVDRLRALSRDEVNSLEERDMRFRAGPVELPFTGQSFILSFSLPNFYFHTATAYDLLRSKGVPLAKRYYMGRAST